MLAVATSGDADERDVAAAAQRFLSAIAFAFNEPAEDLSYGSSGEPDPFHWAGRRAPQAFAGVRRESAPAAVEVDPDPRLRVALAYYREGLNAGSPFYRFVAFWNVLAAVFGVEHEIVRGRPRTPTAEAQRRDAFIRAAAPRSAWRGRRAPPITGDVSAYFRDDARNAVAHVHRTGRREIDPDDPGERVRLSDDSTCSATSLARRSSTSGPTPSGLRVVKPPGPMQARRPIAATRQRGYKRSSA